MLAILLSYHVLSSRLGLLATASRGTVLRQKSYALAQDLELRAAIVGTAAVLLSFGSGLLLENAAHLNADAPLIAVVLALTLARTQRGADLRGRLIGVIVLPLIAMGASQIGNLMLHHPNYGDALFALAVSLSIWLRRFGQRAAKAGTLLALPFVAILVTPVPMPPGTGATGWSAAIALIAFVCVCVAQLAAHTLGFLREPATVARRGASRDPKTAGPVAPPTPGKRVIPSTRMAAQMGLVLGAAFIVGRWGFTPRWTWTVITAFVVCSGNRGRGDVVYKSLLRLAGAAGGTIVATLLAGVFGPHDNRSIALIFVVLAVATWLRSFNYAYWAACVTSVLALLQGYFGEVHLGLLGTRLEEILVGTVIAIAVSWFVLPVRTTDVVRRRVADALITLGELLTALRDDPSALQALGSRFAWNLDQLGQIAAPPRAYRAAARRVRLMQRGRFDQLADAIDAVQRCAEPVQILTRSAEAPRDAGTGRDTKSLVAEIRRNIGAARDVLALYRPPSPRPEPTLASAG